METAVFVMYNINITTRKRLHLYSAFQNSRLLQALGMFCVQHATCACIDLCNSQNMHVLIHIDLKGSVCHFWRAVSFQNFYHLLG